MPENEKIIFLADEDTLDFPTLAEAGLPEWPLLRRAWESDHILWIYPVYAAKAFHETYPDMPEGKKEILLAAILLSDVASDRRGVPDLAELEDEFGPVVTALLQELRSALPEEGGEPSFSNVLSVLSNDARRVFLFAALIGPQVADALCNEEGWFVYPENLEQARHITAAGGIVESMNDPALSARFETACKSLLSRARVGGSSTIQAPKAGAK